MTSNYSTYKRSKSSTLKSVLQKLEIKRAHEFNRMQPEIEEWWIGLEFWCSNISHYCIFNNNLRNLYYNPNFREFCFLQYLPDMT